MAQHLVGRRYSTCQIRTNNFGYQNKVPRNIYARNSEYFTVIEKEMRPDDNFKNDSERKERIDLPVQKSTQIDKEDLLKLSHFNTKQTFSSLSTAASYDSFASKDLNCKNLDSSRSNKKSYVVYTSLGNGTTRRFQKNYPGLTLPQYPVSNNVGNKSVTGYPRNMPNENTPHTPNQREYSSAQNGHDASSTLNVRRRLSVSSNIPLSSKYPSRLVSTAPKTQQITSKESQFRRLSTYNTSKELFSSPVGLPVGRRISVCGVLSALKQNHFENKLQHVMNSVGTLDRKALAQLGVGFVCKKGLKPESPNQDDFFIHKLSDCAVYGVFDGHGPYGHCVSNRVQREILSYICRRFKPDCDCKQLLQSAFQAVENLLERDSLTTRLYGCSLSGTTATVVIHLPNQSKLYIAHVGDSRCVLARYNESMTAVEALPLTEDHKPNNPQEYQRIIACGGQVLRLDGDLPHRVFFKGQLYPGLAMSRALGDTMARSIGITSEPDICEYEIDFERDICLCLSSDGVWEFFSSQEAIEMVTKFGYDQAQMAAESLAQESWRRWIKEEGNVVDDITTQVIYLRKHQKSNKSVEQEKP